MMKNCSLCHEEKPLSDFSKCSRNADGRRSECKECQKEADLNRKEEKSQTYGQHILAILSGGPIGIHELRGHFAKSASAQSGVSSALVNLRDRGQLRITGGGHSNSVKMIERVPEFKVPAGKIVRLADSVHWNTPLRKINGVAIQSSLG